MISANELRNRDISVKQNGYNIEEVNITIDEAADTIDAYVNENKELYRKMEILAARIEQYREEEDSIKAVLITAEKMAEKKKKESTETANALILDSEKTAKQTIDDANEKADKIVSQAREYAASIIKEKTDEANTILKDAQDKANDAISSAKIVAQNVLDQAKEISEDLITKSKEEKQAYEILISALKEDAQGFVENLKSLYSHQLDVLNSAKLESSSEQTPEKQTAADSIQKEIDSLVNEIEEIGNAIPNEIKLVENEPEEVAEEKETEFEPEETIENEQESQEEIKDNDETETADPMAAVEAFSQDEMTPIDTSSVFVPEIEEEAPMEEVEPSEESLFENDSEQLPFETYFNIKREDAHNDRTQTISLVPPEEEDDDDNDEPKFKGFFKKKK